MVFTSAERTRMLDLALLPTCQISTRGAGELYAVWARERLQLQQVLGNELEADVVGEGLFSWRDDNRTARVHMVHFLVALSQPHLVRRPAVQQLAAALIDDLLQRDLALNDELSGAFENSGGFRTKVRLWQIVLLLLPLLPAARRADFTAQTLLAIDASIYGRLRMLMEWAVVINIGQDPAAAGELLLALGKLEHKPSVLVSLLTIAVHAARLLAAAGPEHAATLDALVRCFLRWGCSHHNHIQLAAHVALTATVGSSDSDAVFGQLAAARSSEVQDMLAFLRTQPDAELRIRAALNEPFLADFLPFREFCLEVGEEGGGV